MFFPTSFCDYEIRQKIVRRGNLKKKIVILMRKGSVKTTDGTNLKRSNDANTLQCRVGVEKFNFLRPLTLISKFWNTRNECSRNVLFDSIFLLVKLVSHAKSSPNSPLRYTTVEAKQTREIRDELGDAWSVFSGHARKNSRVFVMRRTAERKLKSPFINSHRRSLCLTIRTFTTHVLRSESDHSTLGLNAEFDD